MNFDKVFGIIEPIFNPILIQRLGGLMLHDIFENLCLYEKLNGLNSE